MSCDPIGNGPAVRSRMTLTSDRRQMLIHCAGECGRHIAKALPTVLLRWGCEACFPKGMPPYRHEIDKPIREYDRASG